MQSLEQSLGRDIVKVQTNDFEEMEKVRKIALSVGFLLILRMGYHADFKKGFKGDVRLDVEHSIPSAG